MKILIKTNKAFTWLTNLLGRKYDGMIGLTSTIIFAAIFYIGYGFTQPTLKFTNEQGDSIIMNRNGDLRIYTTTEEYEERIRQLEAEKEMFRKDEGVEHSVPFWITVILFVITVIGAANKQYDRYLMYELKKKSDLSKKKILVIENRGCFDVLEKECALVSMVLKHSTNLEEAMISIHQNHLVVVDVDGLEEVTHFVREVIKGDDGIIIIVAGYQVFGADYCIESPLEPKSLIKLMLKILNK